MSRSFFSSTYVNGTYLLQNIELRIIKEGWGGVALFASFIQAYVTEYLLSDIINIDSYLTYGTLSLILKPFIAVLILFKFASLRCPWVCRGITTLSIQGASH